MTRSSLQRPLLLLAASWLLAHAAQAQTFQQRRLLLDVELQRQGAVQAGAERGEQKLAQRWQLSALMQSDGTPIPYNPLDPEDHRRQFEAAQSAQQRAVAAPMAPMPDIAAMRAKAQALQARCGQDSACVMREATALTAATMPASTQGRLQAYGHAVAACEKQPAGKAREACQAQARRQAGGGVDMPEDVGPATPYLLFTGATDCGLQLTASLDERVEGSFNDVQGVVRYTETAKGSETRRDDTPCPTLQVVLDTRNGRIWTALGLVAQEVQGVRTREESNRRVQRHEGRMGLRWMEAQDWLQQRLNRLSDQGQDQARLPAGSGQADIRLKWSFRPA
ncbi:hypothetical protein [Roseateles asaccharophilus]|uniref:Uncharacterized protein n=1 Tax=Roseateles asaccharophilus TaxID=582607 RepID=A0ABU2AEY3_9BURK|nr:hypothetical protein [Roseateles asaccharophilus]MDR7335779.1 hypothetical protein [Roseateles asaccharophilus]